MKILILTALLCTGLMAQNFEISGKYNKQKIDGVEVISSKSLNLKSKFPIASSIQLSFEWKNTTAKDLSINYSTADFLYSVLKNSHKLKTADMVYLKKGAGWQKHSVSLKNIDFANESLPYHIQLSARGGNVYFKNIKLKKVTETAVQKKASKKMNVLMIISDDLNDYVASFGGHPQTLTPNIDKLAQQGVKFNRAYCQYPVCGPSRASFLHGLYPESSKVLNNTIYARDVIPGVANLFEHFKNNGYYTAAAGKIFHSKFGMYEKGTSLDEYEKLPHAENPQLLMLKEKFDASNEKGSFEKYYKSKKVNDQSEKVLYYGTNLSDDQHSDGRSARKVAEWITKKSNGDKPFLMACGLVKPHVPFYAPRKYFDIYKKGDLQFSDVPEDDWQNKPKIAQVKNHKRFGAELGVNDRENRAGYLQAYLACISFMDAQVKVLLDALEQSGQRDNTVIVFMSDHGYHIGEHFMYGKVTLFEECARVPLIIHPPSMKANGKKTESLAELVDIYPTLVELCGLPQPSFKLQGKSLVPILNDPRQKVKDHVYTIVSRGEKMGRAIRTNRWRYAEWGSTKDLELYDLQKDPNEYNNLAGKAEFKEILDEMKNILQSKLPTSKN